MGRRSRLAVESLPRRLTTNPTRSWLGALWALVCYMALVVALLTAAWLAQHYSTLLQQHSLQAAGGCRPLRPTFNLWGSGVSVRGQLVSLLQLHLTMLPTHIIPLQPAMGCRSRPLSVLAVPATHLGWKQVHVATFGSAVWEH